jgi:hypothetical protein
MLTPSYLRRQYDRKFKYVDWSLVKRMLEPSQVMSLILSWDTLIPPSSAARKEISKAVLRRVSPGVLKRRH